MPRFVVLEHDHPHLHWDLMLEEGDVLRTWRLERPPEDADPIGAEPLSMHRLHYLTYEGPVSGNRGRVRRWDAGWYELVESRADLLRLSLGGSRLRGEVVLTRDETNQWTFRKKDTDDE